MFTFTPIAHPTADTQHPLLLLQADNGERYFFGKIAEGAQRCLTENKIKISKVGNIFLTGKLDWSSIGGLPGMILTIADQGKENLMLHYGNDLLNYIVSTWRYFVFRFGIDLSTNILNDKTKPYKDNLLQVNPIIIAKTPTKSNIFKEQVETTLLKDIVSHMFPKKVDKTMKYEPSSDPHLNIQLPQHFENEELTTNYEVVFNKIRGKFRVEEAVKLGVPRGPLFAKLTKGESVTLDNGTVVTPDQVLEKERSFAKVLVIDIPNDSYLPYFQQRFENYDVAELGAVYYMLDSSVTINNELIQFMDLFNGPQVQHLVSHSKISPNTLSFRGSALTTLKLKSMQVGNYNLPRSESILSKEFYECFSIPIPAGVTLSQTEESTISSNINKDNVHIFRQGMEFTIEPYTKEQSQEIRNLKEINCNILEKKFSTAEEFWSNSFNYHVKPLELAGASHKTVVEDQKHVNNFDNTPEKRKQVETITLGTGSALPSKYRNVISTLVKLPYTSHDGTTYNRNVLLDAGENTIGMMRRMFSSIELEKIFNDLKLVYLSHLHADHHLGIISILREWNRYTKKDPDSYIYIITPWQYNKFVNEWLVYEDPSILSRIRYISCEHLIDDRYVRKEIKPLNIHEFESIIIENTNKKRKLQLQLDDTSSYRDMDTIKMMAKDLKIASFKTCRAIHCDWAYSNTIDFFMSSNSRKTFKVSYSGDTRPNIEKFANGIGQGSDLLIHESTLDNELVEDAIKKRHCTINEAIGVSNAMNAEKLILTHFSQRYPKLPSMDNNIKVNAAAFCFAFDGMIVSYDNIDDQKRIFPFLNKAFAEEQQQEEDEENIKAES
ncbi:tRNase Z [Nakaseomyces bracarensis]|uniref:tRNase Z n=1 Tax=Nakaseomyces bracarensis TaxID=273131 RepID=UPI0038721037